MKRESAWERAERAADYIRRRTEAGKIQPRAMLVLGSGLGELASELLSPSVISYAEIPCFPRSTVEGHAGQLVVGRLSGCLVLALQGRFHYYEGYDMSQVTFPIRVSQRLGVQTVILTNAAGGLNPEFEAGDLMLITDHLNFLPDSPLRGLNDPRFGPRFPSPVGIYDTFLLAAARAVAARAGFRCREGVYAGLSGPAYETAAEVRFLRLAGADAVGMSTVPEALAAGHGGQKVLGVSTITNVLGRTTDQVVTHEEVLEVARGARTRLSSLVKGVLREVADEGRVERG